MKFTCLNEGKGFHFPPCHILSIHGFQLLIDCPLDLSALSVFSPISMNLSTLSDECHSVCPCVASSHLESGGKTKQESGTPLDARSLIHSEPWYKTVESLKLWNTSFIDVVLISSPTGMLGLPFLTRDKDFSATVYATEATARLGQFMMKDLVAMHNETRQFYGPEDSSPEWMKWDEIELLPSAVKEILIGGDGGDLGGWKPLYSAADVNDCMQRVQSLKFAEEACYNGTLLLKAFSSGLEIGTCNWSITSPKQTIAYLSGSTSASVIATTFDYDALQGSDVILFSDYMSADNIAKHKDAFSGSSSADKYPPNISENEDAGERNSEVLLNDDELDEESKKLDFLCSCALDSVKSGGSVLIPISRLGVVLPLLEHISSCLQSFDLKVPMYFISAVSEELLAFLNVIPEWLCKQRQDKFFAGQGLFSVLDLLNEKRLFLFPEIHSSRLLAIWQEPCIVFCPHWSLRIGPAVHLLQHWCAEQNSLLAMEEGIDAHLAFVPFKPMAMKVLQYSFPSGLKLQQVESLLKFLDPKYVLCPEKLKQKLNGMNQSFSYIYYSENETLRIPKLKDGTEFDIEIDLASKLHYTKMERGDVNIARVKGEHFISQGKNQLHSGNEQIHPSKGRPLLCLGSVNFQILLIRLQEMGINVRVEEVITSDGLEKTSILHVLEPKSALIEVNPAHIIISTDDESLAAVVCKAIRDILDCI